MSVKLKDFHPDDIRMMTFEGSTIDLILKDGSRVKLEYESREDLSRALLRWTSTTSDPSDSN